MSNMKLMNVTGVDAQLKALEIQRNTALNDVVNKTLEIAILAERVAELEGELKTLEVVKVPVADT